MSDFPYDLSDLVLVRGSAGSVLAWVNKENKTEFLGVVSKRTDSNAQLWAFSLGEFMNWEKSKYFNQVKEQNEWSNNIL